MHPGRPCSNQPFIGIIDAAVSRRVKRLEWHVEVILSLSSISRALELRQPPGRAQPLQSRPTYNVSVQTLVQWRQGSSMFYRFTSSLRIRTGGTAKGQGPEAENSSKVVNGLAAAEWSGAKVHRAPLADSPLASPQIMADWGDVSSYPTRLEPVTDPASRTAAGPDLDASQFRLATPWERANWDILHAANAARHGDLDERLQCQLCTMRLESAPVTAARNYRHMHSLLQAAIALQQRAAADLQARIERLDSASTLQTRHAPSCQLFFIFSCAPNRCPHGGDCACTEFEQAAS